MDRSQEVVLLMIHPSFGICLQTSVEQRSDTLLNYNMWKTITDLINTIKVLLAQYIHSEWILGLWKNNFLKFKADITLGSLASLHPSLASFWVKCTFHNASIYPYTNCISGTHYIVWFFSMSQLSAPQGSHVCNLSVLHSAFLKVNIILICINA